MIMLKSSSDHHWPWADAPDEPEAEKRFKVAYPSLHAHMKPWESLVDPETGKYRGLRHREDHGRFWWELRSCAYYDSFDKPKIIYQEIQFFPSYALDFLARFGNNKTFILPTANKAIATVLNAPIIWWYNWRYLPHMKDEALSPVGFKMERFPVAPLANEVDSDVDSIIASTAVIRNTATTIFDWLRHEFGIDRPNRALAEPHRLHADGFVSAVRAALPKSRKWSAAEIARLKQGYMDTLTPARDAAANILALERKLSDLVNAAYGLTPEEVALMWRTAPPRMPLDPAEELRRIGGGVAPIAA
jgi:hypothetical protein